MCRREQSTIPAPKLPEPQGCSAHTLAPAGWKCGCGKTPTHGRDNTSRIAPGDNQSGPSRTQLGGPLSMGGRDRVKMHCCFADRSAAIVQACHNGRTATSSASTRDLIRAPLLFLPKRRLSRHQQKSSPRVRQGDNQPNDKHFDVNLAFFAHRQHPPWPISFFNRIPNGGQPLQIWSRPWHVKPPADTRPSCPARPTAILPWVDGTCISRGTRP